MRIRRGIRFGRDARMQRMPSHPTGCGRIAPEPARSAAGPGAMVEDGHAPRHSPHDDFFAGGRDGVRQVRAVCRAATLCRSGVSMSSDQAAPTAFDLCEAADRRCGRNAKAPGLNASTLRFPRSYNISWHFVVAVRPVLQSPASIQASRRNPRTSSSVPAASASAPRCRWGPFRASSRRIRRARRSWVVA